MLSSFANCRIRCSEGGFLRSRSMSLRYCPEMGVPSSLRMRSANSFWLIPNFFRASTMISPNVMSDYPLISVSQVEKKSLCEVRKTSGRTDLYRDNTYELERVAPRLFGRACLVLTVTVVHAQRSGYLFIGLPEERLCRTPSRPHPHHER